MAKKILFFDLRPSEKEFISNLKFKDYEIITYEESLNSFFVDEVPAEIRDEVEILSVFVNSSVDENVLSKFKNLRLIATRSTGCNHIDTDICTERKIAVTNVKSYGAKAVAQYTFGLILALERKLMLAFDDMKRQQVNTNYYEGRNLNNLTIGIVGTGEIGVGVCRMANQLGMEILAFDVMPKYELEKEINLKYVDLDTLIRESDIISLHVPYRQETYHIFGEKEFGMMKKNSYLVNTSRGELVDIIALYNAISRGDIQGCALDVVECEKVCFSTDNLVKKISEADKSCLSRAFVVQKLMEFSNVIITPHIAYNTYDAILEILNVTRENIYAFLKGDKLNRIV